MDKVTIVTVYNACNYGSFLQALALKKAIEEKGYEVNYLKMDVDMDKVIGVGTFSDSYVAFETQKYNKISAEQMVFNTIEVKDLDSICCVLGSDTIWNMFDPAYASVPYFVGKGLPCKNIISYAASVGQNNFYKIIITKSLKLLPIRKLNGFGVRDDKTERLVKLYGRRPVRVLDPTFLSDFNIQKPEGFDIKDYLLVYTYGFNDSEVKAVRQYALANGLNIVATGSLCEWADYNLSVGSYEWLWLVKNANCVVTNTFHGTVFSIKYNKRFATFGTGSDKIISLLAELDLADRNCQQDKLTDVLYRDIDYDVVNESICQKKEKSLEYLYGSIKCEN